MACLFPHASLETARSLVADAVARQEVTAVMEGHPHTQSAWQHEGDLPFSREFWRVGDVDLLTEAW
eukprot:9247987-Prorocentrum_lima.AAC.1